MRQARLGVPHRPSEAGRGEVAEQVSPQARKAQEQALEPDRPSSEAGCAAEFGVDCPSAGGQRTSELGIGQMAVFSASAAGSVSRLRFKVRSGKLVKPCLLGSLAVIHHVRPNHSLERTHPGMPHMAFISFWAMRVLPARAAQLKR
jgi:hypothetical protein